MQPQEKLDKLRNKVGYLNGRRKVLAMAELAEYIVNINPAEARSMAADAAERARSLMHKLPEGAGNRREYVKTLAYALAAYANCMQVKIDSEQDWQLFEEAAELLEEIGDWDKLFETLDRLALNHRQYARLPESLAVVERALALAETLKLPAQRCRLHAARATVHTRMGNTDAAAADTDAALDLLDDCRSNAERISAYALLAERFYQARMFDMAIDFYNKVIALAAVDKNYRLQATIHWQLNFCYRLTEQRDKLLPTLQDGYRHARESGVTWLEAAFTQELGGYMKYIGNFARALEYLHRCEELYEQMGDHPGHICAIEQTGLLHLDFEDSDRGRQVLRRAFKLAMRQDPDPLIFVSLSSMLRVDCWDEADLENAIAYALKARDMADQFPGSDFLTNVSMSLGSAYMKLGRRAEARSVLDEGLATARERRMDYLTIRVLLMLAELLLTEHKTEEALEFAQEAEGLFKQGVNASNYKRIAESMLRIHEQRGDYRQAFRYLQKLQQVQQSRFTRRNHDIVAGSFQEIEFKRLRLERNEARRELETLQQEHEKLKNAAHANALQLEYLRNLAREWREELRHNQYKTSNLNDNVNRKLQNSINEALSAKTGDHLDTELSGQEDFNRRLAETYPALSQTERKVCALIKAGAGSKDICKILHVSPRTIETYRYRIRRKMQLDADTDLILFIVNLF